ncbi:hypothetical protein Q8A73_004050 [Channa argus]|nr:hypothetical protein Q8A73_004050 [Channa argus]
MKHLRRLEFFNRSINYYERKGTEEEGDDEEEESEDVYKPERLKMQYRLTSVVEPVEEQLLSLLTVVLLNPIREQRTGARSPQEPPPRSRCCKLVIMRPGRRL